MIEEDTFCEQLRHARAELNIDNATFEQYSRKLEQINEQKQYIRQLLCKEDPDPNLLLSTLVDCIRESIKYPEFISLYMRFNQLVAVLVKVNCLLDLYHYGDARPEAFMNKHEY